MNRKRAAAIATVLAAILATTLWLTLLRPPSTEDEILASGTVEATEADLGFQVAGRIESIGVDEGDRVAKAAEIAFLDRSELQARKRAAEAQAAAARAFLTELESGFRSEEIEQARAAVRVGEEKVADARRDVERSRRLFEGGAVSRELLDKHETVLQVAREELAGGEEQLRLLETGTRKERIAAQRAALAQTQATIEQIEATLDYAVIRAPFDGVVTVRHREPGETVTAGAPVVTLMNPDDRWVRIYVREDEVGRIGLGQPATITADADPDRVYQGSVIFISNEAEFTPRNVQTTRERVKLVYRLKVRITGDAGFDLKPGLAADVRLGRRVREAAP